MAACTLSCTLHFQTGLYAAYPASKTSDNTAKPHVGFCASAAGVAMYQSMMAVATSHFHTGEYAANMNLKIAKSQPAQEGLV